MKIARLPFLPLLLLLLAIAALISSPHLHLVHAQSWRQLRIAFDHRFIDSPALDSHVITGLPMTCISANSGVYANGLSDGQDCFDSAGTLTFTSRCRLECLPSEVVPVNERTALKDALADLATNHFQPALTVRSTDNSTVRFQSTGTRHCEGLTVLAEVNVAADILVFVTMRPMRMLTDALIHSQSSFCELVPGSQRPAVVRLNVDPRLLTTGAHSPTQVKSLLMHELVHSLGYHENMYNLFKHPVSFGVSGGFGSGQTYFAFSPSRYPTGPAEGARVTTVRSGNFSFTRGITTAKTFMRGPATSGVIAEFFLCPALVAGGIELENGGVEPHSAIHLEKRLFLDEIMVADYNGTTDSSKVMLSRLTLALLHDTGFYLAAGFTTRAPTVNHTVGTVTFSGGSAAMSSSFGEGLGCDFVSKQCSTWPAGYFCSTRGGGCSYSLDAMGVCDLVVYPASAIPSGYRYIPNEPNFGGSDTLRDYCPRVIPSPLGSCTVPSGVSADLATKSGMYFGPTARCFVNRIVNAKLTTPDANFPGCLGLLCGSSTGPTAPAYVIVGAKEVVPCKRDNAVIELFPPPRANIFLLSRAASGADEFYSYLWHGQIACSKYASSCTAQVNRSGAPAVSMPALKAPLPQISFVDPPWGHIDGGSAVTIVGERLTNCVSASLGGIAVKKFKVLNDTAIEVEVGIVPNTVYGGSASTGIGDATVQLECPVPELHSIGLCNPSCIVDRKRGIFSYDINDPRYGPTQRPKNLSDFWQTIGGKIVGAIVSICVTILMIWLTRKMMEKLHGPAPERKVEEKEGDDKKEADALLADNVLSQSEFVKGADSAEVEMRSLEDDDSDEEFYLQSGRRYRNKELVDL